MGANVHKGRLRLVPRHRSSTSTASVITIFHTYQDRTRRNDHIDSFGAGSPSFARLNTSGWSKVLLTNLAARIYVAKSKTDAISRTSASLLEDLFLGRISIAALVDVTTALRAEPRYVASLSTRTRLVLLEDSWLLVLFVPAQLYIGWKESWA
ncbi:hypothetical protein GALMADRAFT_1246276 [Galerina marginata CBS 339.88]|uniref:Uncharacterized protein n=1 Tax=Galerina marginata (strain CBS 339.88) TaxID=685588 RepID=A0A067TIA1_GALM3|nr:hypothetical protein GALMADRAFT_1246276 [Galerina marginata CBS 339.88]